MFTCLRNAGEKGGALCTIEGNFGLEPSRSKLSAEEATTLRTNRLFLFGLAETLHTLYHTNNEHGKMLRYLLARHDQTNRDWDESDMEKEAALRLRTANLCSRLLIVPRLDVALPAWLQPLAMTLFVPCNGDHSFESQLQHLLSTVIPFAQYIRTNKASLITAMAAEPPLVFHRAVEAWKMLRICMHFSAGIDGLSVVKVHEQGKPGPWNDGHELQERVANVELKWILPYEYNHPLRNTDVIMVWDLDEIVLGESKIVDKLGYNGVVKSCAEMEGFGYCLPQIGSSDEDYVVSRRCSNEYHVVYLISLRDLIVHTLSPFCDVKIASPLIDQFSFSSTKASGLKAKRKRPHACIR
jgi:hypothetical protein